MTELDVLVRHWIEEGVISPEQGEQIMHEQTEPIEVDKPRGSLISEALGYVGGVLVLLAIVTIATLYWPSLGQAARNGLAGGAAVALLVAGILLPATMGAARTRLRAVLWALAVGTTGLFIGICADGLGWAGEDALLAAASVAAGLALVLWLCHKTVVQQAALAISVAVAAGSAAAHLPDSTEATVGLALWGIGLAWLTLVWGALLTPVRTGYLLGGATAILGIELTAQHDWGLALTVVTVVAMICAAVILRDLWLLGVGSLGVLTTVPIIINRFFEDELAAPLSLLAAGVALIALGVATARRRGTEGTRPARAADIAPAVAVALAVAVLLVVALIMVVMA